MGTVAMLLYPLGQGMVESLRRQLTEAEAYADTLTEVNNLLEKFFPDLQAYQVVLDTNRDDALYVCGHYVPLKGGKTFLQDKNWRARVRHARQVGQAVHQELSHLPADSFTLSYTRSRKIRVILDVGKREILVKEFLLNPLTTDEEGARAWIRERLAADQGA